LNQSVGLRAAGLIHSAADPGTECHRIPSIHGNDSEPDRLLLDLSGTDMAAYGRNSLIVD